MVKISCGKLILYVLPWILLVFVVGLLGSDNDAAVTVVDEDENEQNGNGRVKVGIDHTGGGGHGDPFIATHEWQKVKKGQSIPKGLHVRMNIQTNEIEAKLLDDNDEQTEQKSVREHRKQQMTDIQESADAFNRDQIKLSRQQIKDVLKNLKHDQDDVKDEKVREESVKKKFRSLDELREEMKKMEVDIKTDSQIIGKLWERYTDEDVTEVERVDILHDLEYYLHQYDNARDFAKMGGLEVLNQHLNSTSDDVRREVALVVASAVQSNPGVQIKAIEVGIMHQLIRLLSLEKNQVVRSRILAAAASLVRHFPYAQKKFLQLGGLDAMLELFQKPGLEKLQVKAVTLLGDLLNELNDSQHHPDPLIAKENFQERLRQYREVGLVEALQDQKWCHHIASLLTLPEHDSREKVLTTMSTLVHICRTHFRDSIQPLEQLKTEYETLSKADPDDDDYFSQIHRTIENMLNLLKSTKDEL